MIHFFPTDTRPWKRVSRGEGQGETATENPVSVVRGVITDLVQEFVENPYICYTEHGFAVHLYRLSKSRCKFSRRDWSSNSGRILGKEKVAQMIAGTEVEVLYGMYDATEEHENGGWHLVGDSITRLI